MHNGWSPLCYISAPFYYCNNFVATDLGLCGTLFFCIIYLRRPCLKANVGWLPFQAKLATQFSSTCLTVQWKRYCHTSVDVSLRTKAYWPSRRKRNVFCVRNYCAVSLRSIGFTRRQNQLCGRQRRRRHLYSEWRIINVFCTCRLRNSSPNARWLAIASWLQTPFNFVAA